MTNDTFGRDLDLWLREDAERRVPDHLAELLVRSVATRQRPWWSSPERWLPVQTTLRLAPAPRVAWVLAVLALLLAIGAVAIVLGSRPPIPVTNGAVIYGSADGDIYRLDPGTGESTPLIAAKGRDTTPYFSPDGSKFAYVRLAAPGRSELTIAKTDGTTVRSITRPRIPVSMAWSRDGTMLAVVDSSPEMLSIVDVDGSETREIDIDMQTLRAFWRPNGRELVILGQRFTGGVESFGLFVVRLDGTVLPAIVPPVRDDADIQSPALSPDGTQVIYGVWDGDQVPGGNLYVANVDTGEIRMLTFRGLDPDDEYYFPEWSPDGSQIVFNVGQPQEWYHLAVASSDGGDIVDIGPTLPWDAGASAAFSPDATKVIAQYNNGSTWLLDIKGGPGVELEISTYSLPSWQSVTP
jgi:Tol biopolymer transport system component